MMLAVRLIVILFLWLMVGVSVPLSADLPDPSDRLESGDEAVCRRTSRRLLRSIRDLPSSVNRLPHASSAPFRPLLTVRRRLPARIANPIRKIPGPDVRSLTTADSH